MPLSSCSSPVNPCDTEDACIPVGHVIVTATDMCKTEHAASTSNDAPPDPAVTKE